LHIVIINEVEVSNCDKIFSPWFSKLSTAEAKARIELWIGEKTNFARNLYSGASQGVADSHTWRNDKSNKPSFASL
jgi:hypothetical protein